MYLFSVKSRAHIWDVGANDTLCRMWSTGGLGTSKKLSREYRLSDHIPSEREVCGLCKTKQREQKRVAAFADQLRFSVEQASAQSDADREIALQMKTLL